MLASSPTIEYPFWGFVLSVLLFGVLLVQTWRYYSDYGKDRWYLRVFVAVLFLLSCTSTAMHIAVAHSLLFLAADFKAVNFLDAYSPFMTADNVIICFVLFLIQLFFLSRIYFLRPNRHWILGALVLCSIGTFVTGIVTCVLKTPSKQMISWTVLYGLAMFSDAVTATYYWWIFAQSRSDFRQTKNILKRLRLYTAARGLLVTVAQTICFVLRVVQPHQLRWVLMHWNLSGICVFATVALLNARGALREKMNEEISWDVASQIEFSC
ncbi:hypothetical protein ARMGADRAFT_1005640 [Armillaria gallica]|uniref:DUF6534 domain-containing protein n=1 Tax=Armillaria gallica TaxID=47427 RepID=A0A2H3EFC0_ARMGA|nr:hypothetical protein ARMGADRAFT_1005640 [Armillaria gallica]